MRQAGRYMPQYRKLREKYSFLDICHSPELMADVTLQPIDEFDLDAAIIFSDILLPLIPAGLEVSFGGNGPVVSPAIETTSDVGRLKMFDPYKALDFVLEGIALTRQRLADRVPLIGFTGSPFTLAVYAVEGGSSRNDHRIKRFIKENPMAAHDLLDYLAEVTGHYLKAQIAAGAQAVQIFDSRGGNLSGEDYQAFSLHYLKKVFRLCRREGIPRMLFLNNASPYLDYLADLDCEVIGVDWRSDIKAVREKLPSRTLQGNLDPHSLYAPEHLIRRQVHDIIRAGIKGGNFIFNLGHGVTPQTPMDAVRTLVHAVHDFKLDDFNTNENRPRLTA